MSVVSFKCPYCDGELIFDPASGQYKCEYCLSKFTQDELEKVAKEQGITTQSAGGQSGEDTSRQATTVQNTEEAAQSGEAVVYNCPSCGAEIVTDATTAATFCYYCHNPVILGGRLEGDYLPDKVIPFEITKEQAIKKFLAFVEKKKFIPKAFFSKKQIETISGVYFPYWNYNTDAVSDLQASAKKIRTWTTGNIRYTETKFYHVERQGTISLSNISENALKKANGKLALGLMPYHFDKMQDFHMGYLSGFMAEKRDIEKESIKQQVQAEAKKYADIMMRDTINGYNAVSVENAKIKFNKENWQYCLLPVWTITYKGTDGKIYYYSMNGQTGEVCGELPVDHKKAAFVSGVVSAVILILGLLGGYFIW